MLRDDIEYFPPPDGAQVRRDPSGPEPHVEYFDGAPPAEARRAIVRMVAAREVLVGRQRKPAAAPARRGK